MPSPNKPHRASPPQYKARRGFEVIPYQRETWTPSGWLLAALLVVGSLLVLVAGLTR